METTVLLKIIKWIVKISLMHNEAWGISYSKDKQDKMADGNEK